MDFKVRLIGDKVDLCHSSAGRNRDFIHAGKVMQFRVTAVAMSEQWNKVPTLPDSQVHPVVTNTRAARLRGICGDASSGIDWVRWIVANSQGSLKVTRAP